MKKLLSVLLAVLLVLAFAACDAETEPVRDPKKDNKPAAATFDPNDVTEREIKEGDTIIIKVSVYHGNGEVTDTRISAAYGQTLSEVLLERTFITGDMNTVDGEYANPDNGASWILYIDGVFNTDSWDTIVLENGSEYMFEFTSDVSLDDMPEGDAEGDFIEDIPEEDIGEPEIDEPVA